MDTTLEEARRCPKCQEPGQLVNSEPKGRRGGELRTYTCRNSRCLAKEQRWVISVTADGTIPPPRTDRRKFFPSLGADRTERVRELIDRQLEAERTRN